MCHFKKKKVEVLICTVKGSQIQFVERLIIIAFILSNDAEYRLYEEKDVEFYNSLKVSAWQDYLWSIC